MFTIRTAKRIYQRVRSIDKARRLLNQQLTEEGKRIPKTAFIHYGPADIKRLQAKRPEQNLPLGLYLEGHVI